MAELKCFGIASEIISSTQKIEGVEGMTVADLRQKIAIEYPEMVTLAGYMVAVNHEYAEDSHILTSDDEIAIIPPVSGG